MNILSVTPLAIPDVKVVRVGRFGDARGYFTEVVRESDLLSHPHLSSLHGKHICQVNESQSEADVIRGLHLQVDPNLDKLVRVISGKIIDVALDVRPTSPTFGRAVAYAMKPQSTDAYEDMILVPFGFAHGLFIVAPSRVQYFQTGDWNGKGEVSLSPLAPDIDWSLIEPDLKIKLEKIKSHASLTEKDKAGINLSQWLRHPLASHVPLLHG